MGLVLDVVALGPCLDLVAHALELLYLAFQVVFQLFLLCRIVGLLDLLVDFVKFADALIHLLETLVHLLLQLPGCHGAVFADLSGLEVSAAGAAGEIDQEEDTSRVSEESGD